MNDRRPVPRYTKEAWVPKLWKPFGRVEFGSEISDKSQGISQANA